MSDTDELEGGAETEGTWCIEEGTAVPAGERQHWRHDEELDVELENLTYSNPFNQELERVWFDGKIVFAAELGASCGGSPSGWRASSTSTTRSPGWRSTARCGSSTT